ncbi:hypothetical protein M407DRAFT_25463 [Tulasnella calospora MUT 4182]|uniref:Uncharacterized protein n=1 Tax=Tulasnella calospora MUT 4182 TaxID=1051891 RepID=A0A0C3QHJ6_9AGAM|nr:hypothetical protein M407DRAFT_25463 [Tulasnella calospora MUT 4182]
MHPTAHNPNSNTPAQTHTPVGRRPVTPNEHGKRPHDAQDGMDEDLPTDPTATPMPARTLPRGSFPVPETPASSQPTGGRFGALSTQEGKSRPKIPRTTSTARSRATSVAPSEHEDRDTEIPDVFEAPLSPEEAKKRAIEAFRAKKRAADQEPDEGLISFPRYSHPRSIHTNHFWGPYLQNTDMVEVFATAAEEGATFPEEDLLRWGFKTTETKELVKGFKLSEYQMPTVPWNVKAILMIAATKEATQRILENKVVTYRSPEKSGTFWVQLDGTWGTHIIVDIYGGGNDFEKDVLPHFWRSLGAGPLERQDAQRIQGSRLAGEV